MRLSSMALPVAAMVGAAIALVGCSPAMERNGELHYVVPDKVLAEYQMAAECCKSPAEFQYVPLPASGNVEGMIDGTSPAFTFDTGKSFFLAYRLPDRAGPYVITVTSPHGPYSSALYCQGLLLLDEKYEIVGRSGPPEARLMRPTFFRGHTIRNVITVPAAGEKTARYLVIHTTPAAMTGGFRKPAHDPMNNGRMAVHDCSPVTPYGLSVELEAPK